MVSKEKLYTKLDSLEMELEERLIPHLEQSIYEENDLIFCVAKFNPYRELRSSTDKETEELVELGSQILTLKNKLGEPSAGSLAERICWYCREWANIKSSKRRSEQDLARQFLAEIKSGRKEQAG